MIQKNNSLYPVIENIYKKHDAEIEELNIFGIRNEADQDSDIFNDQLGIMLPDDTVYVWPGTTDPGKHATMEKDQGAAHLCLGYHADIWQVGIHAAKNPSFAHRALVQTGNSCKIWRDNDRNYLQNKTDKVEEGYFGINFHRASAVTANNFIGPYSFGCQVTKNLKDFEAILSLITGTKKYQANHAAKFSYLLVSIDQITSAGVSL